MLKANWFQRMVWDCLVKGKTSCLRVKFELTSLGIKIKASQELCNCSVP